MNRISQKILLLFILAAASFLTTPAQAQFEPAQGISIVKTPSTPILPAGGGEVTYTYELRKNSLLNSVTPTPWPISPVDDKCAFITPPVESFIPNGILEADEVWTYQCTTNIEASTLNTVLATATEISFPFALVLVNAQDDALVIVDNDQCGDGNLGEKEDCDDGNLDIGDGCDMNCKTETCGNGIIQSGNDEFCDDGNALNTDLCANDCRLARCGDGFVQSGVGEQCEPGLNPQTPCTPYCRIAACGDGIVNQHFNANTQQLVVESCDDGNQASGDGCTNACQREFCGDGTLQAGNPLNEQCDDGNAVGGDGCSAACASELCGDGIVQGNLSETCDDGNATSGDGCSATCASEKCGDGSTQTGGVFLEQCDDGNQSDQDGCNSLCRVERCGDGIVQSGLSEQCDDGNAVDGDGCSAICQLQSASSDGDGGEGAGQEEKDDLNGSGKGGCSLSRQAQDSSAFALGLVWLLFPSLAFALRQTRQNRF